jgi:hypothetical protein
MALPVFKPEQLEMLARLFAEFALEQLGREFHVKAGDGEPPAEPQPVTDTKGDTST